MNRLSIALFIWPWILITITQPSDQVCEDGDVRLSGGRHYREGRVEVCRNQQWGRVCNDDWDKNESTVVCRQLGFSEEGGILLESGYFKDADVNSLPFLLDDLGCTGSESSLLECLPKHNCKRRPDENVNLICFHNGVKLEFGTEEQYNNTLFTEDNIGEGQSTLFCSTDRTECCFSEFDGGWFLPNGSRVLGTNHEQFYVTRGNQTIGLNCAQNSSLKFSQGIYHCEMMDKNNVTHYLYAGIYPENEGHVTNVSVQYERISQTITCTSTGGPATDVTWSKDSINISLSTASNVGLYDHSQIIINTTSATYENKLRIVDKSSEAAGIYTCSITNSRGSMNESLNIQVCRDTELRVNNKSNGHGRTAEVCIDDEWHEITSAKAANNSQSPQDISVISVMIADSTSVTIIWSWQQSSDNRIISGYDSSCTTSSLSDHGQIHEVRVSNISTSTTAVQVSGLLPGTAYECCVNAHIQTNTPLDLISSSCDSILVPTGTDNVTDTDAKVVSTETGSSTGVPIMETESTSTRTEFASNHNNCSATGLGIGLGIACLLLMGSIVINIILFLMMRLKNSATKFSFKPSCTNELYEESDSEHDERLVGNPIYGDALPGENETDRASDHDGESYDVLHRDVGTAEGVTPTGIIYEVISNLQPSQPINRACSDRDTETLQTDDASVYAKLGAVGIDQ